MKNVALKLGAIAIVLLLSKAVILLDRIHKTCPHTSGALGGMVFNGRIL